MKLTVKERDRVNTMIDKAIFKLASGFFPLHDDIRSSVNLRVEEALLRFDKNNGTSIFTFLSWQIKGAVKDFIRGYLPASRRHHEKIQAGLEPSVKIYAFDTERYTGVYNPYEEVDKTLTINQIVESDFISEKERCYLLLFLEGFTLKEIGKKIGVTESRCSQMFPEIVGKIRKGLRNSERKLL